jgi:hypothetical protein
MIRLRFRLAPALLLPLLLACGGSDAGENAESIRSLSAATPPPDAFRSHRG